MASRYILNTECLSPKVKNKAAAVGYASMIMFMCKRSSHIQVGSLYFWIIPAIDHEQVAFFFNTSGAPVGYVTWAHLAEDVEQRLLTDPGFLLHPSEWNEGGRTWIIDYCFPHGGIKESINELKKIFRSQDLEKVSWVRRNANHSVKKISHIRTVSDLVSQIVLCDPHADSPSTHLHSKLIAFAPPE